MLRHTALGIPHVRSLKNAGKEKKKFHGNRSGMI